MVSRFPARFRLRFHALLVFLSVVSFARGQNNPLINLVNNPNIGTTTQTLNPLDAFTGTLTVGTVGQNFGTISLSGNYTSLLPIVLTGNQSTLNNSGGTFTLLLASTGSLTRTGSGAGTYSQVFTNLNNQGNIVVNQGTLFVNGNLTSNGNLAVSNGAVLTAQSSSVFTNTGTANVTGAGSVLTVLNPINTGGTIIADSNALLQLGGTFVTGNLGAINLINGGTVEITGTLDNTGGNLTAPAGGVYTLNGGTIKNGTIVDTAIAQKSGTLDGATVLGNITVGNQTLTLKNGAGATNITTVGTVGQNFGTLSLGSSLSTPANSSLVLTGNQSTLNNNGGTFTLTVPPTASLTRTGSGAGTYSQVFTNLNNQGNIVVNQGTLFVNGNLASSGNLTVSNGAVLTAQSTSVFTNTGTANVTGAGSTLVVLSPINTGGTIISDSSALLQLGGTFVTGNLGTINLTNGGTVEITGTLDNTGGNLTAPAGGVYTLNGGTIKNGTVVDTAFNPKSGTLDGATIQGNLTLGTNSLTLKNAAGATNITTIGTVGQNFGTLSLGSDLSTPASSSLVLTGNQSTINNNGGTFTLTVTPTASLTRTGSGTGTYSQVFTNLNNQGNIVVNQGTLFVNGNLASSGNLTVSNGAVLTAQSTSVFTNTGTANVTGSGSVLTVLNVANTGSIMASLAGDVQFAGNFTTASLGAVDVSNGGIAEILGNLTNTAATLTAPTGGAFTLTGTIVGGNIVDTALIEKSGVLDGATVQGNLTIAGGASPQSLTLKNGATFTGTATLGTAGLAGGTLYLGSPLMLAANSNVTVTGLSSNISYNNGQTTLTVSPTSTFLRTGTGTTQIQDHLVNQGTLTINGGTLNAQDVANASNITVATGTSLSAATGLTQTAGTLKVDGTLFPSTNPGLVVQGGSVTGAGNIQGTTTFSGGTLDPGSTIGTLTFTGNLTLTGGATTLLELGAGTNLNDKVVVTSGNTLVFGGALDIVTTSTVFASGQSWNLFSFTNSSGSFASLTLPNTSNGWIWDTSQLTTTGVLTLTTFVPVPEPSTYALLAAGLGLMFVAHRWRAASRAVPCDGN